VFAYRPSWALARVRPTPTYLLTRLTRFLTYIVTRLLTYSPLRIPYPPHFSAPRFSPLTLLVPVTCTPTYKFPWSNLV